MPKKNESWKAIGRRKSSVARVLMSTGKGSFIINKRDIKEYFGRDTLKMMLAQPLSIVDVVGKYDIIVVSGSTVAVAFFVNNLINKLFRIIAPYIQQLSVQDSN